MRKREKYLSIQQKVWLSRLLNVSTIPAHYKSVICNVIAKDCYNSEEQYLLNLLREDYGKGN
jgi:hypothetical protein